jgi:hypothetical protein
MLTATGASVWAHAATNVQAMRGDASNLSTTISSRCVLYIVSFCAPRTLTCINGALDARKKEPDRRATRPEFEEECRRAWLAGFCCRRSGFKKVNRATAGLPDPAQTRKAGSEGGFRPGSFRKYGGYLTIASDPAREKGS